MPFVMSPTFHKSGHSASAFLRMGALAALVSVTAACSTTTSVSRVPTTQNAPPAAGLAQEKSLDKNQPKGQGQSLIHVQTFAGAEPEVRMLAATRTAVGNVVGEIAYSQRQGALFVAVPGRMPSRGLESEQSTPAPPPKLLRLDPKTLAVQAEIVLPSLGFGLALDDAANRLYIGHSLDGAVSMVDTASNRVIQTLQVAQKTKGEDGREHAAHHFRQLQLDPGGQRLYLPGLSERDSALYILSTNPLRLEKRLPGFGFQATGIALDVQGQRLFVSNMQGQVMVVDMPTLTLRRTFEVEADQLINLSFDPVKRRLLGVDQGLNRNPWRNQHLGRDYMPRSDGHQLMAIDPDSGKILAIAETDKHPLALLPDASAQRLYVSNFNAIGAEQGRGTVLVFDSRSHQLLQSIALPPHPASIALDAQNQVLYVALKNDAARDKAGLPEQVVRLELGR